jgi:diguanylate cyclase (GGDEF)-like protein
MLAVLGEFGGQLFPGYAGAVALSEARAGWLQVGAKWGEEISKAHFGISDCWGLRRGRLHSVEVGGKLYCSHLSERGGTSLCVPLYNRGETLGVLSLYAATGGEDCEDLGLRTSESLAVALNSMRAQERLREQKSYDTLTGLGNSQQMERVLRREIERAARGVGGLSLLVLDIDDFGKLNERLGKELGDIVLKTLSTSLSYQIRGRDLVCRTAGDEFAIMFPETDKEVAQARSLQIQEKVRALRVGRGDEVQGIKVSLGLGVYQAGDNAESLLERARARLQENKASRDEQAR